jgi:hypothetical protein
MAIYTYPFSDRYQVRGTNNPVLVSIFIGNGQGGSYSIYKNDVFLAGNESANLGSADSCRNNTLRVSSTIQDKLSQTNWTSVTVVINEDGETTSFTYSRELPQDNDIARYKITIEMS